MKCVVISSLILVVLAIYAYKIFYGPINTNQLLVAGYKNLFRNRVSMQTFAEKLYASDGHAWLAGKTILVTGTTSGLGEGIASHIYEAADSNTVLILPVRSAKKHTPQAVAQRLRVHGEDQRRAWAPNTKGQGTPKIIVVEQDLSDLDSIDASIQRLKDQGVIVDVLVNNAGLIPFPYRVTKQKFDIGLGVNFIGTVHFTLALKNHGLLRTPSRVIMVSSEEHRMVTKRFDDPEMPPFGSAVETGMSDALERYAESKLALTTFSMELASKWSPGITVHDVCPGPVASDIASRVPVLGSVVTWLLDACFPSRFEAALPVLRLALDPAYASRVGEVHHHMAEPLRAAPHAMNRKHRAFVFEHTLQLLEKRGPPS